ncbi:MAG: hypothetical protein H7301_14160 [Cryobacterium sp.]|nr:hypothetical protein [Oligoflexia bacterium]
MILHPAWALPLLLVGWLGFSMRKTALGGVVAILIAWQGLLATAALFVFHRENPSEGAVLLWFMGFAATASLLILFTLALRQYYGKKNMRWAENEEIKH